MSSLSTPKHEPFIATETDETNETVVFHSRRRVFSANELMARAVQIARERKSPVVLVSAYPLPEPPPGFTNKHIFSSRVSTVRDETFDVYKLEAR